MAGPGSPWSNECSNTAVWFPICPSTGESFQRGPFEMDRAATAVAELVRSRVGTGRVHVVGHSLGAQVGAQLLATEPELVDRAVLCGTIINAMPGVRLAPAGVGRPDLTVRDHPEECTPCGGSLRQIDDYRDDVRLMPPAQVSHLVESSRGSDFPRDSTNRIRPHCF